MIKFDMKITEEIKGKPARPYNLDGDLHGDITHQQLIEYLKSTLIIVADLELKEQQQKGFPKDPIVVVDNIVGKPVSQVKPFGSIVFNTRQEANVVLAPIYAELLKRSPEDTGMYKESHFVTFNGKTIANSQAELNSWLAKKVPLKNGDVIRFVNVMPYAGKLERKGITAQRRKTRRVKSRDKQQRSGPKVRAPNGTYFLTSRAIIRKFKFNSNIRFEWINGANLDLSKIPKQGYRGNKLRQDFKEQKQKGYRRPKGKYVYPSIVVRINERGLIQK